MAGREVGGSDGGVVGISPYYFTSFVFLAAVARAAKMHKLVSPPC